MIWNHRIETTMYKWLPGVPGSDLPMIESGSVQTHIVSLTRWNPSLISRVE